MASNGEWERVADRAIARSGQSIAKYGLPPNVDYGLFEGNVMIGHFKTADEAMKAADEAKKDRKRTA